MAASYNLRLAGMTVTPSPFAPSDFACAVCRQPHHWMVLRQTCCDALPVCSQCLERVQAAAPPPGEKSTPAPRARRPASKPSPQ